MLIFTSGNLFAFASVLLAATCFCAERGAKGSQLSNISPITDNGTLQEIIINKCPTALPTFLVSYKCWEEELAWAFAFGLILGKFKDMLCKAENCAVISVLGVNPENIKSAFSNLSYSEIWGDKYFISNLFKRNFFLIRDLPARNSLTEFVDFRSLIVKCSLVPEASIAVDVAILKWIAAEIRQKPEGPVVVVEWSVLQPLCALSMVPLLREYCTNDILFVLNELSIFVDSEQFTEKRISVGLCMIQIIKMLDDGPIREKVVEIATKMYTKKILSLTASRLILGSDHPFVKSMEKDVSKVALDLCASKLLQQHQYDHKVHSISNNEEIVLNENCEFIVLGDRHYLNALITTEGSLRWNQSFPVKFLTIWNSPGLNPKQMRIFFLYKFPPPATFWTEVKSCTNLPMLHATLNNLMIRRMILTYGITILESSSNYSII